MPIRVPNILKKIISAAAAGAMLLGVTAVIPADTVSAADAVSVNLSDVHQTIRGFGGINHPEWAGDLTSSQRATAFGNGNGQLGLDILRIYVNDDKNQWSKALATAKDAISKGAIVFASPWNPPASMTETFTKTMWNGTVQTNAKRLRHDKYRDYALHLNDFVTYMKNNGVDLYAISIQNEPDYGQDWTWWTEAECLDFIENYAGLINCRVISPESFSYTKSYYDKILNSSKAMANIDIFGTHFYGTSKANMAYPLMQQKGQNKEIWMTEVYVPNSDANSADRWPEALKVDENIHDGLVTGNMSAYVWWYIRRNYGLLKEDGNVSKRGYCMAQFSKYVRPGYVRVGSTESPAKDVFVSAYKGDGNKAVIVAVNESSTGYTQQFSLQGGNIKNIDRYRTSSNENLAETKSLENSGSEFWAQLPAQSVSTFVITLDGESSSGTDTPKEPVTDADGYYFHDTFEEDTSDWAARGSVTLGLSGRTPYAGTNALLVSERTSAWNGSMKPLSQTVFKPGSEYSFSAMVKYFDGNVTENFSLTLQYTGSDGTAKYANIASAQAVKGEYVQLANTDFKIPDDAADIQLVAETTSGTQNFYLDEVTGAPAGKKTDGPAPKTFTRGDLNSDGKINIVDFLIAKNSLMNGFSSGVTEAAADVDQSGVSDLSDVSSLLCYLLGMTSDF